MNKPLRSILWSGAVVAVPAAINAVIAYRSSPMEQPLPGDIAYYDWIHGRVAFYRLGQGPPLLLVHHPSAGGSAWEWRKVFPELANRYTVYALDLLGFGLSEKPNLDYTGPLLAELIHDFLEDVIGQRAEAVGSGLGAAYLVNVAVRRPELLDHLVLANPTGTTNTASPMVEQTEYAVLRSPVLGTTLYNYFVSMGVIRRELTEHIYHDPTMVTPEMVCHLYSAAHQPGSQYSTAAYISGRLDVPMRMAFTALKQPVLLVWGAQAHYTPEEDAADLLFRAPHARLTVFDNCGMLPHDEQAGLFIRTAYDFLAGPTNEEMAA